jgi:multidrug efflux pump subunit AcrA (membrane-fusion protein)
MKLFRRELVWLSAFALVVALGATAATLRGRTDQHPNHTAGSRFDHVADDDDERDQEEAAVKTIHPKRDPTLRVMVQQLATVEPFFQANLRSQVAGVVKYVAKDIGDRVRQGELLAEIDVPDLRQEIAQKESVVAQRRQELELAKALVKNAAAAVEVAQANIEQKQTEVRQAKARREYREKRLERYRYLAKRTAISPDVVDEEEQSLVSAQAAEESAQVAVRKAQADCKEKEASREAALAEVKLKEALIVVAFQDLERSRALADYARITAPFDGVITRRNIDPGAFVQNATTATTEALMTVARNDIVTVGMKVPDNAAPFITRNTEAEIQMDDLPGVTILGRVTRFSPSIESGDRTMKVEVDLFNGTEAEYRQLQTRSVTAGLAPLGFPGLAARLTAQAAGLYVIHQDRKGGADELPLRPTTLGGTAVPPLLPGMTGYMKLCLNKFTNAYLLPSSAVFSRGGKPYILVVRDGVSKLVPVKVQVNDGKLAKVAVIARSSDPRTGTREVLQELSGDEEVIASRQQEVGDGRPVKTTLQEW